jgi:hypothetical protein
MALVIIATSFVSQPDVFVTSYVEILSVAILVSLAVTAFRHFNCHVNSPHFCWRFGHPVEGTHYRACRKHHPTRPAKITAEHIALKHKECTEGVAPPRAAADPAAT